MAIFGASVPREFYEEMKLRAERAESDLRAERLMLGEVTKQLIEIRRMGAGLPPTTTSAPSDAKPLLGPLTQIAIDMFASGSSELAARLTQTAFTIKRQLIAAGAEDDEELDRQVAKRVEDGDQY